MLCRTLYTNMPFIERFAAREMDQGIGTKFAFRLLKLREAFRVVDERRQKLVAAHAGDENTSARDAQWQKVLAEEVPEDQRPKAVGELNAILQALRQKPEDRREVATPAEQAALIALGLATASDDA